MKISTKSWHYKFMDKIGITTPYKRNNLCSYIRGLILSVVVPVGLVISPFILYFAVQTKITQNTPPLHAFMFLTMLIWGIIGSLIDALLIRFVIQEKYGDKIKSLFPERKHKVRIHEEKHPDIIIEYLKAKKKKICPMIEFVDE